MRETSENKEGMIAKENPIAKGCFTTMLVILVIAIIIMLLSVWNHHRYISTPNEWGDYPSGIGALDFISPLIMGFILFVIIPITLATAYFKGRKRD